MFLFALGISAIYSVELSRESAEFILVRKQLIAFGISIVVMLVAASSNHLQLRNYARILYIFGVVMLVAVFFLGSNVRGTTGWFIFAGFSFQPVEFMKLALAVRLARFFSQKARLRLGWKEVLLSGALTALPTGLAMMQPDLGSAILLVGIWIIMLFFAGLRPLQGVVLAFGAIASTAIGWIGLLKNYQKERLLVFLHPSADPLSSGYNIAQAKIAIGSGKFFGRGLGFGSQSQLQFLPESQTDFVFAVIAEELGYIGVLLLMCLFGLLYWRFLFIAFNGRDHFTQFLAIGLFASIFVQMFVNIGVNLAVLPTTGVALPFVSYGGSSLLISFLMIGIMQSMAIKMRPGDKLEKSWYHQT
ncbi:rod shape-determining protein RodA [Patescibacteria group bacterium]|nr:rod shape-determining protein RodA [Patescibacteria group bacterium]